MTKKLPPQGDLNFMYGINQAKNNTNRNDITGLGFHIWPISGDTGTGIKLVKMQSKHFQLVTSTAFQRRGLHKIIKHNTGDDASHREACQNTQLCTCKTQKITRIFGEPQTFLHCLIFFFFGGGGGTEVGGVGGRVTVERNGEVTTHTMQCITFSLVKLSKHIM